MSICQLISFKFLSLRKKMKHLGVNVGSKCWSLEMARRNKKENWMETYESLFVFLHLGASVVVSDLGKCYKENFPCHIWGSKFLCRLITSLGPWRRRKGSGALKEEKRTNIYIFYIALSQSQEIFFFLNSELLWQQSLRLTFFKPRANDYTTKQFISPQGMFFLKRCTSDYITTRASLISQNLSAMQETQVDSWIGKIPWRRKWQPTPVFLAGESHGQRSLAGYSPWGCKS